MGKLTPQAHGEVKLSAAILKWYGRNGERLLAPETLEVKVGEAELVKAPVGVLLGVMPWNFPLYQVVRFAGPNLAAGNTVLLKHASQCPQTAVALEQLFLDAGIPQGGYTNLLLPSRSIERVIANERVQGVSLTGSERAGTASPRRRVATSRSACSNWAGATRSSCSTPTIWTRRSRPRPVPACPTRARPAIRPSDSS